MWLGSQTRPLQSVDIESLLGPHWQQGIPGDGFPAAGDGSRGADLDTHDQVNPVPVYRMASDI